MPTLTLHDQYTYPDILEAYLDCRKRKRNKLSSRSFELDFERRLWTLLDEVNNGTYVIGPSNVFVVTWPKAREVWAASFRDRIVHHLIYRDIGAWYESRFIEDTYSCIKNRGTLSAIKRLETFARRITNNWDKPAYCLQVDIANFFVAIRRSLLWSILEKDLGTTSLTSKLCKQVIFNDVTRNAYNKTPHKQHLVPRHKSLFYCHPDCGLPIGNLTSQFLSNVYLDAFDKFVKHTLKVKYYVRYVDDAILLHEDPTVLTDWVEQMDTWLRTNRYLHFHKDKVHIFPVEQGMNFVGAVVLPFRTYLRNMTAGSAKEAVYALAKGDMAAIPSVNSYLGMSIHHNTYRLRQALCAAVESEQIHSDTAKTKIWRT